MVVVKVQELMRNLKNKKIVLMPDFFLDHLLCWPKSLDELINSLEGVAGRGGGNIRADQDVVLGGGAAKVAWVLSFLGVKPVLLTRTSSLGLKLLEHFLDGRADLSMVRDDGELALTAALETSEANVMFNSTGSVKGLHWWIIEGNRELLSRADAVGIFSWNLVERATRLAQSVFSEIDGLKFWILAILL